MDKEKEEIEEKINLNKSQLKYLKQVCSAPTKTKDEKTYMLMDHFVITKDVLKEWLDYYDLTLAPSQFSDAVFHTLKESKRYLISSAQNACPANVPLLNNMKAYAKHINAEIGIIATRYKNPTSIWKEEGDTWDKVVHPYLTAKRQLLHKRVLLLADLKIQATSPNPTNGIEVFAKGSSVIVGAPRIEMRSIAVLEEQEQEFIHSTGTVTVPSFTDSVAGGKAAEHHSYGFVVVEIESDDTVHIRNVSAHKDGSFNDLIYRIKEGKISTESTETLVWGDSHFAQKNSLVTRSFKKLCRDLDIEKSVLHDVWDSACINVHNIKNPVVQVELWKDGKAILKDELLQMQEELTWFENNMDETLVIASNHDDMLDRAIVTTSWRDYPPYNAQAFVKLEKLVVDGKAPDGIIPYFINKKFRFIKALGLNDSYIRHGVQLALHGHKGPNGSRGSVNSFAKLSTKTIIGHSHSPSIKWGCYQVGISCGMKHGYNNGLSGWAYNGVTLNRYGKRQSITFNKNTLTYTTLY